MGNIRSKAGQHQFKKVSTGNAYKLINLFLHILKANIIALINPLKYIINLSETPNKFPGSIKNEKVILIDVEWKKK